MLKHAMIDSHSSPFQATMHSTADDYYTNIQHSNYQMTSNIIADGHLIVRFLAMLNPVKQ